MKQLIFLLTLSFSLNAQKIVTNEVDEFTKNSVKKTSWVRVHKAKGYMRPHEGYLSATKINNTVYLNLKLTLDDQVYAIHSGDKLMILMTDETVVELKSIDFQVTSMGAGAVKYYGSANRGTNSSYVVSSADMEAILNKTPKKIRIYTSIGYIEDDNYTVSVQRVLRLLL